jgi:hypothetical protein
MRAELDKDDQVMALMQLLMDGVNQEEDLLHKLHKMSRGRLAQGIIGLFTHLCAHGKLIFELKKKLEMSRLGSVNASTSCKSSISLPCSSCDSLHLDHDKLKRELRRNVILLESANEVIDLPCFTCKDLRKDLDCARDELTLLKSNDSLPCTSCEFLLAKINELKLTHSTCVDELEHTRAKIDEISSRPCSLCSLNVNDDACLTSCDNHDALLDVNDDVSLTGLIFTSCIEFENEVLALKQMRDDMSAKLVEQNEMSANLEKENELLHTTYAECIGKEMENLKNAPCGTCDRLKFENEVLAKRCKSFCAKSLDSRDSCNSDVGVSKIASLQPELSSCVARESLDDGTCAKASDSSSIASPKLVGSLGNVQVISHCKGASCIFGTQVPKPTFHCTFCKKTGHSFDFCFRHVKHERRV